MDKRDTMLRQLMMRGWATVDQLLEASFGEWPPRGLEIAHANPQKVALTSSLTEMCPTAKRLEKIRLHVMAAGMATLENTRRVFLNPLHKLEKTTFITAGHETAHILQGDHYYRARDLMGHDGLSDTWALKTPKSDAIVDGSLAGHFVDTPLRRTFNKVAEKIGLGRAYYGSGIEMQARLHEALLQGYPKWQRLPQNQTEFYFAMHSMGFAMTPDIRRELATCTQKNEMEKLFPSRRGLLPFNTPSCVTDIAKVEAHLSAEGCARLWTMAMPGLYCDLIEMYGDRLGRERFGYGLNETHLYRQRHQDDETVIRAADWHYVQDDAQEPYACTCLDDLPQDRQAALPQALNNQYISLQTETWEDGPHCGTWLFVSGEKDLAALEKIITPADQIPAARQPAAHKNNTAATPFKL